MSQQANFLKTVAQDILSRHNDDLSDCLLLFPTYRSLLYFRKSLAAAAGQPVWAPHMYTLDSYIRQSAQWQPMEDLDLCIMLYKHWQLIGGTESFEDFYGLGLMLLQDFDELDKSLTDTNLFFDQLKTIAHFESHDNVALAPELKDLAQSMASSSLSKSLGHIWLKMGELYTLFRNELIENKIGSSAVASRYLLEQVDFKNETEGSTYVIGMYQLSVAEKRFLTTIAPDVYYWNLPAQSKLEALDCAHPEAQFIKANEDCSSIITATTENSKTITYIPMSGDMAQLQLLARQLEHLTSEELDKTGIVLPDQSTLLPLLNVIPERVKHLNVSMGLSSMDTPVYSMLSRFIDCLESWDQNQKQYIEVKKIELFFTHELIARLPDAVKTKTILAKSEYRYWKITDQWQVLDERWKKMLSPSEDQIDVLERCLIVLDDVYELDHSEIGNAAIYHLHQSLLSLKNVMDKQEVDWSPAFFGQFLKRILKHTRITLKGEPLKGLQILGLFEMVNLTFERLFVLQCNEGTLPTLNHQTVFPHTLARKFGLTGFSDKAAVQDYLFWNLVESSYTVMMLYNAVSNNGMGSEASRWIQRLVHNLYPKNWIVESEQISIKAKTPIVKPILIKSNNKIKGDIISWLEEGRISPTAINTWLTCRLRWYLQYVLSFRNREDDADEMDAGQLGNIVHKVLEDFYNERLQTEIQTETISMLLAQIQQLAQTAYAQEMKLPFDLVKSGKHQLYINAIVGYLNRIIQYDQRSVPFTVIETEKDIDFVKEHKGLSLHFKGKIDRVDRVVDGPVRLIDYKTGKSSGKEQGKLTMDEVWAREGKTTKEVLQTLLYTWMYYFENQNMGIPEPHLYFVRGASNSRESNVSLKEGDINREMMIEFEEHLLAEIDNMVADDLVIDQTTNYDNCKFCDFKSMCGRD